MLETQIVIKDCVTLETLYTIRCGANPYQHAVAAIGNRWLAFADQKQRTTSLPHLQSSYSHLHQHKHHSHKNTRYVKGIAGRTRSSSQGLFLFLFLCFFFSLFS